MSSLWTEEFFPKNFEEFIGNSEIVENTIKWAKSWESGAPQKPLLLFGAPGTGKTCLAYLIARHFKWSVFEMNSSDSRDKDSIEKTASAAAMNSSLSGERRLVLFDEIDCILSDDRGGAVAILAVLKEAKNPVILTANDLYSDKKLAPLREYCEKGEFKKINYLSIAKRLRELLSIKGVEFDEEAVKELAKNSGGDFRAALLDSQSLALSGKIGKKDIELFSGRERDEKIFSVLSKIFFGKTSDEIRKAVFYSDVNQDLLVRWVEENIPRQFRGQDIANAFNSLSRADVFSGRIMRRQNYGFMKYTGDLSTLGVNSAKTLSSHSFTPFMFPTLLSKLSRSSAERETRKSASLKIGRKTHASVRKTSVESMPFLSLILQDREKAALFFAEFDFSAQEAGFLLSAKHDSKKVENMLAESGKIKAERLLEKNKKTHTIKESELDFSANQTKLF